MRFYRMIPAAATATCLSVIAASGQVAAESGAIDRDGDGRYSLPELRVHYPGLSLAAYLRVDVDGDGWVSPGEFRLGQDEGLLAIHAAGRG